MTSLDHIWINANPQYREQIRRANEARAATYYAAWRAVVRFVGHGFSSLAAAIGRARREARTRRELSALSDRQLEDIGLWRSEIPFIAQTVASVASEAARTEITLADLPRIRSGPIHGGDSSGKPHPAHERRGRLPPLVAKSARARVERRAA